jgi:cellulose synthase (UDP-forming)
MTRTQEVPARSGRYSVLLLVLLAIPALMYVLADLPPRQHVAASTLLVGVSLLIARFRPEQRIAVLAISLAVSTRYIYFRLTETVEIGTTPDAISGLFLVGAELYAFLVLVGGYFQTGIVKLRTPLPLPDDDSLLPTVDVFIPTYNEDPELLRDTVNGAIAMDYPRKTVYLLDDGRRDDVKALAAELGCEYLRRADNRGAKAGNVNAALARTSGQLIAMFDADHVPSRRFLQETVGFFLADRKLALVQTPHHFYNADHFERNLHLEGLVPSEQKFFYHVVQPGNDFWNSAFFCGSCAVISREAMVGVGGMAEETLTEDAHTALKMHAAGWNSAYLDLPLAAGLATERQAFYITQRIRWARGMAQIFRLDNPLLKPGLSMAQRFNYLNATWHFLFGIPRLVFLLAPTTYLLWGWHPVIGDVREVLLFAAPHLALTWIGGATSNRSTRHSFWAEVFETVMAPYAALVTTLALIAPRRGRFNVTTKGVTNDRLSFDWRNAVPTLVMMAVVLVALVLTPNRIFDHPLERDTILVAAAWNLYNLIILLVAAASALERPQRRTVHRVMRSLAVRVCSQDPRQPGEWVGRTVDVSTGGVRVELDGVATVPLAVDLYIDDPGRPLVGLPAVVRGHSPSGSGTELRTQFQRLDTVQRAEVSQLVFGSVDPWTAERYPLDRPLRSALSVLLAPVVAVANAPGLLRRVLGVGEAARGERASVPCRECGAKLVVSAGTCPVCGTRQSAPLAWRATPRARGSIASVVGAALLLAVAVSLTLSWRPAVAALQIVVPVDRWTGTTFQTRMAVLNNAWTALQGLVAEFDAAAAAGRPLPDDWARRVENTRRSYRLGLLMGGHPASQTAESALLTSALLIDELGALYSEDPRSPLIGARREAAANALADATRALGLPEPS